MIFDELLDEMLLEYKIVPWDEYAGDYDPWITADQADIIAKKSGIRIDSQKELSFIAIENDEVVGAVWSSITQEEKDIHAYDFDIAVDPDKRSDRIGLKLIDNAIEEFRNLQTELGNVYIKTWVVNPKLARVLEQRYKFSADDLESDGTGTMTYHG